MLLPWLPLSLSLWAVASQRLSVKAGRVLVGRRVVNQSLTELGVPAFEWTESEAALVECVRRLLTCYGQVPPEGLRQLTATFPESARCFEAKLFACHTRWTHLSYQGPVWYPARAWTDRYFSLRRFPSKGASLWCLFFRRAHIKGQTILPFDTCQVCADTSHAFVGKPSCNIGKVWRPAGFARFENSIHHNMAFLATDQSAPEIKEAVAFGGRHPGVWRLTAPLPITTEPNWEFHPEVEVSRYHPGCLDLKLSHYAHDSGFSWNCRFPNCGCALDGRLSAVSFRNQTLLYARANVKPQGGGRFVQVARQDELGWGAFSAIHILDYDMFEGDIYMFYVNVNPANSSTLLALFPILDRGKNRSSIAMSLSEDGVWWSSVVDLIATVPSYGGRTFDHPVDGLEVEGTWVHFFVHHNVPGIGSSSYAEPPSTTAAEHPSSIHRYAMGLEHLATLTGQAVQQLRAEKLKHPVVLPKAAPGSSSDVKGAVQRVGLDDGSRR
ncbi:unnamed protein product [Effrenium voratum]|nr:unnamed protein product [Effrenium voratum]